MPDPAESKTTELIEMAVSALPEELGCDDCFEFLAAYADYLAQVGPEPKQCRLVAEHLERCAACREELAALLEAIKINSPAETNSGKILQTHGVSQREDSETMKFTVHSLETAPDASVPYLQAATQVFGFLPNLLGVMAEAPISLRAYIDLTGLLAESSLSPLEQQLVMIAGSYTNECGYCIAAHSTVANALRMAPETLVALRSGEPIPDPRLEALRSFTHDVVVTRGRVSDARIQEFLDAGFTRQNVLEVVFGVAMKTLSNYTNHIAETPLDPQFASQDWHRAA